MCDSQWFFQEALHINAGPIINLFSEMNGMKYGFCLGARLNFVDAKEKCQGDNQIIAKVLPPLCSEIAHR